MARRSGTRRRSTGSASRRSWCPTARMGCAPSPVRATTSASVDRCRPPASPPRRRSPRAGTPNCCAGSAWRLAREARACNLSVILGPGINMKRSPLCGRNFEYLSEDPYLAGELAVGIVDGIQSPGRRHVGQALRGEQPGGRPAPRGRRGRRANPAGDLPPGLRAGGQGDAAVDGDVLLQQGQRHVLLREPLAADRPSCARSGASEGLVVSDWGAVLPPGSRAGGRAGPGDAAGAGAQPGRRSSPPCESGELPVDVLDTRVRTVLELVDQGHARAGARRDVRPTSTRTTRWPARRPRESVVLLKNDGIAAARPPARTIAVIGEFARTPRFQGAGSLAGQPDPGRRRSSTS